MRGFSKAIITGNLTRDPEMRALPSGTSVCGFSVAVNRVYRDANGENKDSVSYLDCSAWGKLGETISKYAHKGTGILVSGRLEQRSWEDKNTGQKRSRVEIVVEDFNFLGQGDSGSSSNRNENNYSASTQTYNNSGAESAPETSFTKEDIPSDIPEGEVDLSEVPF